MNIVLNLDAKDINKAVLAHITKSGIDVANKDINIAISIGRKGAGPRAEVTLTPTVAAEDPVELASVSNIDSDNDTPTEAPSLLEEVAGEELPEEEEEEPVEEQTTMFS